jgi:hypothetical protein
MTDAVTAKASLAELAELEDEARAWFDPPDEETHAALARLATAARSSSLVDLARPDSINLAIVRTVAQLPAEWDIALVLAGVALAAIEEARDTIDDEAYARYYVAAGRDALRLAELADAPKAATRAATEKREADAFDRLQDFAVAWRGLGAMPWKRKVPAIGESLGLSEKHVERMHAEANRLGLLLDPLA